MKQGWFMLTAAVFFPAAVFSHGVDVFDITGEARASAQTVRFMYSTGEAMMYAKIALYSPSSPDIEILQSVADRNGCFSFVPDEAGVWRVTAEDGMGHKGEIPLNFGAGGFEQADAVPAATPAGKPPLPLSAALGLSLLVNVFGLWYYFGKKKKDAAHAH